MTRASPLLIALLACSIAACSNGPRFGESGDKLSVTYYRGSAKRTTTVTLSAA